MPPVAQPQPEQPSSRLRTTPGEMRIEQTGAGTCLCLRGDWTLAHYRNLEKAIAVQPMENFAAVDFTGLTALDTAGATLLVKLLGASRLTNLAAERPDLAPERRALLEAVAKALKAEEEKPPPRRNGLLQWLADVGEVTAGLWQTFVGLLNFLGLALLTLAGVLPRPRRWRLTSLVTHIHQTGLDALPIVALLTFLVGAVVAFLGATVLINFGATIYTVDLVAYSFLREFGVLLTAILMAGRTASAFTAQIGSMKVNQELDALRAQGLDPIEMLVLPRMLALLITLPLLTFVAMLAGMTGGAVVSVVSLDISLTSFLNITQQIPLRHFLTGMAKAPVFAVVIALIGCLEGFKVEGSARSVGNHTTSSVVQSIFMVILLDAVAALFFMEMGW
ncbi:MAG: ABC transporter permease [Deltaproteobacteria bacterium]|nr:ABC transporter permease [Deltaproteobacteria bacterium]